MSRALIARHPHRCPPGTTRPTLSRPTGLVAFAYTESKPSFASWSIARHDVEIVGVLAFRPMSRSTFTLHGQLGIGAAFDRLSGVDPETSTRALSAISARLLDFLEQQERESESGS